MYEGLNADSTVVELRSAFDAGFAVAPGARAGAREGLLTLRVGGDPYLLRLAECGGLTRAGKVVPVPSRAPSLLGVAGVRGGVVPVFSLAALLGYGAASEAPEWLVLCGPPGEPIALAVVGLDGTLQLSPDDFQATDVGAGPHSPHTREVARTASGSRAVISIRSVLEALRAGTTSGGHQEGAML